MIFNRAKSVRFLVPLTQQQLNIGRGMEVCKQIEILKMICQENLEAITNTCIPVITKVKPVAEEAESDGLVNIKCILDEQLKKFNKNQFTKAGGPFKDMKMFETPNPDDADDEKEIKLFN